MRYFLIAGEASGDLHGGNLIKALKAEDSSAEFRFWGGDCMAAAAGMPPAVHYRDGAVMGIGDVLAKLPSITRRLGACKKDIALWKPDAAILIDYPGFNLKVARFCHKEGIKVLYYIAPKTWASREHRNAMLKAWIDRLFIIFPFEVPYFQEKGIPFTYTGNPLVDEVEACTFVLPCAEPYLAILPGSRMGEISHTLPVCLEAAKRMGMKVLVAGAPSMTPEDYAPFLAGDANVELLFGRTYDILKFASAAMINSGTASLEAALIGTPQVVCWSSGKLTWFVGKKILRVLDHVKYISLANLCLDKVVFKELLQDDFNVPALVAELHSLVEDPLRRSAMQDDYAALRKRLGSGGASRKAAEAMINEIKPQKI